MLSNWLNRRLRLRLLDGRLCALELSTDYLRREQLAKAITPTGSNCKLVANPDLTRGVFLPIDIKFVDRKAYSRPSTRFRRKVTSPPWFSSWGATFSR